MNQKSNWKKVDFDSRIWETSYYVPNFKSRSLAILFQPNRYVVFSPGASNLESFCEQLLKAGKPEFILIPNSFHHFGIKAWKERFPECRLVCSEVATSKLKKLGHTNLLSLEAFAPELPDDISIVETEGTRSGEVWLRVNGDNQVIWIIGDAFFNYSRFSNRILTRTMQRIADAAPGLKISRIVKWYLTRDRKTYKKWALKQVESDKPTILVPLHGEIDKESNLSSRIKSVLLEKF